MKNKVVFPTKQYGEPIPILLQSQDFNFTFRMQKELPQFAPYKLIVEDPVRKISSGFVIVLTDSKSQLCDSEPNVVCVSRTTSVLDVHLAIQRQLIPKLNVIRIGIDPGKTWGFVALANGHTLVSVNCTRLQELFHFIDHIQTVFSDKMILVRVGAGMDVLAAILVNELLRRYHKYITVERVLEFATSSTKSSRFRHTEAAAEIAKRKGEAMSELLPINPENRFLVSIFKNKVSKSYWIDLKKHIEQGNIDWTRWL